MGADLLGLFEAHGLRPVKKTAGEWASPCPACGGTDRCMIKPADHGGMGGYWCRQCGAYGDAIQFLRDFEKMSYAEACRHVGVAVARSVPSLPRVPRQPAGQEPFTAVAPESPAALWQTKATAFAAWAHQHLLGHSQWLAWLAARGLPLEAVARYRLGYNPGDRGKTCLIRPRASWGLPPVEAKPGKDGQPGKPKTTFWIPRGVVIPQLPADPDGPVRRLRVRRPDEDRKKFKEDTKYYVIPGSSMDAMILGQQSQAFVVVESELDALMLHHHVGDLVGVVSIQTANVRNIAADVHAALSQALCILVALDAEGAGGAGAKGWARWATSFPRAKRWPCPVGKDPGEAFERGANLRAWVMAGLPPALLSGRSRPGRSAQGEGENREQGAAAAVGAAETAAAAGEMAAVSTKTPDLSPEMAADGQSVAAASTASAPEALPPVRWLTPDYDDAADVVPIRELVAAMASARVEPVLLSGVAGGDDERVLALSSAGLVSEAGMGEIARLFFGPCLEAVLAFANRPGLRVTRDLAAARGLIAGREESAVIVRRGPGASLEFSGWANLAYWRGRMAAQG